MPANATTLRFPPKIQTALATLSRLRRVTMNKLVTEAVESYLDKNVSQAQTELQATLSDLHAYLDRDPKLDKSVEMFVKAEARNPDPIKTRIVRKKPTAKTKVLRKAHA